MSLNDTSLTEEEAERSLRDVLPSEGERRRLKRNKSNNDVSLIGQSFSEDFTARKSSDVMTCGNAIKQNDL